MPATPTTVSEDGLAGLVRPGESIYLTGGLTPPVAFIEALQRDPQCSRGLRMTTSSRPESRSRSSFAALHSTAVVSGLFMQPELRQAQQQRRYRMLPMSFGGFLRHLQTQEFDLGVVQVAPPDVHGRCSLGPSVEFTPAAPSRCRRVVAIVNPGLPSLPFSPTLPFDSFAQACTVDSPARIPRGLR